MLLIVPSSLPQRPLAGSSSIVAPTREAFKAEAVQPGHGHRGQMDAIDERIHVLPKRMMRPLGATISIGLGRMMLSSSSIPSMPPPLRAFVVVPLVHIRIIRMMMIVYVLNILKVY